MIVLLINTESVEVWGIQGPGRTVLSALKLRAEAATIDSIKTFIITLTEGI